MTEDIVGSHFKAQRGRGQNQDQSPSSVPAKPLAEIPNVSTPNASAEPWAGQVRDVGKSDVKPHDSMVARTTSDGSPGGTVPSNSRPVTKPAPSGTHER